MPFYNRIARVLLETGVPLGPNAPITIRGRRSGRPRSTPLALIEASGRRWVWAPWGEVDWVRNLRAAGRATVTAHRRSEEVRTTELTPAQRMGFFRDVLAPLARSVPFGMSLARLVDGVDLNDPGEPAGRYPVFELHAA